MPAPIMPGRLLPILLLLLLSACQHHTLAPATHPQPPLSTHKPVTAPPNPAPAPATLPETAPVPVAPAAPVIIVPTPIADPALAHPAVQSLLAAARKQQLGQHLDAASASLERAARLSPHSPLIYRRLADIRKEQQRYHESVQFLRKAIVLAAGNSATQMELWQQLADTFSRMGNNLAAEEARARAEALASSHSNDGNKTQE